MDDAECAQIGTEMFFPEKGGSTKAAKTICGRCPVVQECLEFGAGMSDGIWGGKAAKERAALRRSAA